jgi:hypothetical protein
MTDLTVPYTGQTRMRLTIASGLADARIHVDPDARDLIAIVHGEGLPPRLDVSSSELRLSCPSTLGSWLRAALVGEYRYVGVVLHPAVAWTLDVRGGLARFDADLVAGKLARLDISGGVSDAILDLPAPAGVTPIRIAGGVSNLGLRRPAAVGVAVTVDGGVSDLRLDEQRFGAIGGGARLASGAIDDASRYALEIRGGASGLLVAPR